jgi:hypothetical protein
MFNILTYDKIPAEGLSWLSREKYSIAPPALLQSA